VERVKAWRKRNRYHMNAQRAEWRDRNREKYRAWMRIGAAKRRGRLFGGSGVTIEEWNEILTRHEYRCAYCGSDEKIEQDHIRPLSRGGQHCVENVIPACSYCNRRKGAKLDWTPDLTERVMLEV